MKTQVAVIGGGPGGYVAAIRAAQMGLEVTLVEQEFVGGVCLNWGCIPSKALVHVADLKEEIERAGSLGVVTRSVSLDLAGIAEWKNSLVEKLRAGVASLLSQNKVETVPGRATFTGARSLSIQDRDGMHPLEFQNCILATGSSPAHLPGIPFDGELVVDSKGALNLTDVPEHFVVVGAGSVGLELGMVYAKLGSRVTVFEGMNELLPMLDRDVAQVIRKSLDRHGMELVLGARALAVERQDSAVRIVYAVGQEEKTLKANRILVAVGRWPNTGQIGLERTRVTVDKRGFVNVDSRMQASVPGMYAIGDVVSGPMLAHKASYQGKVAAEVIAGEPSAFDGVEVPSVIFTDPEIASVGMTEREAHRQGVSVKVGTLPFRASGRALTLGGEVPGFAKVVSDAETGTVYGVHIVGPHASDLIGEGCLAVALASHVDDLTLTMHPHPTLSESIEEAAEQVERRAIHIFNP